jgi:hypothetical protein
MKGLPVRQLVLITWLAASGGCAYGPTAKTFRPAESPSGVEAHLSTSDAQFSGELIEVRSDALVLLSRLYATANGRMRGGELVLRLIPFTAVRTSRFEQMGSSITVSGGRAPDQRVRDRLRLVSRFPHGLSEAVWSQLLAKYGQTALAGVQQ